MKRQNRLICIALMLILSAAVGQAQNSTRTIAVVLEEVDQTIPDLTLAERLNQTLAMHTGFRVIIPERDSTFPNTPGRPYDGEWLFEWGREVECRYILHLQIRSRRIVTRKQTSLPYVLSRYVVEGQLIGDYRLLDLNRNKVIGSWKLNTRLSGPRQWQLGEDYPGDPDLHLSAPGKLALLGDLEEKAVEEIMLQIQMNVRGR